MLHAKRKELQAEVKTKRAEYIKHEDDKRLQTMLSNAIKLYIAKGEVASLNSCLCTWESGSSHHKYATAFIKAHCNVKQLESKRGARKFIAHDKPAKKETMGRKKWYSALRTECQDRQDKAEKKKREYMMDILSDFSREVAKVDRYVKNERTTESEKALQAQAIMHKAQAEMLKLYAS